MASKRVIKNKYAISLLCSLDFNPPVLSQCNFQQDLRKALTFPIAPFRASCVGRSVGVLYFLHMYHSLSLTRGNSDKVSPSPLSHARLSSSYGMHPMPSVRLLAMSVPQLTLRGWMRGSNDQIHVKQITEGPTALTEDGDACFCVSHLSVSNRRDRPSGKASQMNYARRASIWGH